MSRDSALDQNLSGDFQKNFSSDLNDICYVGRGRWVMHEGMPYGRNQASKVKVKVTKPLKVWIPSIFKTHLLRHLQRELANDHLILKLEHNI